jgi:hypothetical protein
VLGFAAVPITGGRLGDISGRKRLFVIGVAGFTLASLWCGVAGSPEMLIVALFFEGAMAGPRTPQIPVVREWSQMREVVRGRQLIGPVEGACEELTLAVGERRRFRRLPGGRVEQRLPPVPSIATLRSPSSMTARPYALPTTRARHSIRLSSERT